MPLDGSSRARSRAECQSIGPPGAIPRCDARRARARTRHELTQDSDRCAAHRGCDRDVHDPGPRRDLRRGARGPRPREGDLLADASAISLAADTVRFELSHNPGGFLSLGTDLPQGIRSFLFIAIGPVGLLLACVLALRSATLSGRSVVGLGLVAGGGVANWLDRVAHGGAVTDFVSLGLGPLRSGIFNVADVCVVGGALLLILATRSSSTAATAA